MFPEYAPVPTLPLKQLDTLSEVVSEVAGNGKLLTIQPQGNHGDALIRIGCQKLFKDMGVDIVSFRSGTMRNDNPLTFQLMKPANYYHLFLNQIQYFKHSFNSEISAVYIHGGANFNDFWSAGARCYTNIARVFDAPIIIGPQSGVFDDTNITDIFDGVSNQTHFLCRDKYTHDMMSDLHSVSGLRLYLEDDTALYLDTDDLPVNQFTNEYSLVALRTDKESSNVMVDERIEPPIEVCDISLDRDSYQGFINTGAKAKKIYTDRLHGAILAVLLNKPVRFYQNAYHKNRGVYEMSLSDCDDIEFVYDQD